MAPYLHLARRMKWLLAFVLAGACFAQGDESGLPREPDLNVNARYHVESVDFAQFRPTRISSAVAEDIESLVGETLNVDALTRIASLLKEELRARSVQFSLARGSRPAYVRVIFTVDRKRAGFEVAFPQIAYLSTEGWSGGVQARLTAGANAFIVTGLSNSDALLERYSGLRLRYERMAVGSDRVRFAMGYESFHENYDPNTLTALANRRSNSSLAAGAYLTRTALAPTALFVLSHPLTLETGVSFVALQPGIPGASSLAANAVTVALRYRGRLGEGDRDRQDIDGAYTLRAATRALGSDLAYARHAIALRYKYSHDRHSMAVAVAAGVIYGKAPLFERFSLGNSSTLRGWNKYDLDPLGGNRMANASVSYGYRVMRVFYDTGAVWEGGQAVELKHSLGAGLTSGLGLFGRDALLLAVAFPLRERRMEPVFIAGMNF